MTKSLSKIVKSNFVSFTEQKKEIKVIENNDPKVLKSSIDAVDYINEIDKDAVSTKKGDEEVLSEENEKVINEIKEKAEQEAYQKGLELGQQDGYKEGYESGYEEGKIASQKECSQVLDNERENLQ